MMKRKILFLFCIGLAIRLVGISQNQILFGDEGVYLMEARYFGGLEGGLGSYFYAKPFFTMILSLILNAGQNVPLSVLYFQALVGAILIPLTYWLTKNLFENSSIAWIAAVFCAFDPWIILVGQHVLADSWSLVFWVGGFCLLSGKNLQLKKIVIASLCMLFAVLTNYRMLLFTPFFLCLVAFYSGSVKQKIIHCIVSVGILFIGMLAMNLIYELLRHPSGASYFGQLRLMFQMHAHLGISVDSWKSYFYAIYQYEGAVFPAFMGIGLFSLFFPQVRRLPFFAVLFSLFMPMAGLSLSHHAPIRIWAPLLYWHGILASAGITHTATYLQRFNQSRARLQIILSAMIIALFIPNIVRVKSIQIPYQEALQWLKNQDNNSLAFLSPIPLLTKQLIPKAQIEYFGFCDEKDRFSNDENAFFKQLGQLKNAGFRYFLLDHYRMIATAQSLPASEPPLSLALTNRCGPKLQLECRNPKAFWTYIAWEHNNNVIETVRFIKNADFSNLPCIEIYDLEQCRL